MKLKQYLPYLAIFAVGAGLLGFLAYKRHSDLDQIRESYILEKSQETELTARKVEDAFRAFYQGLRTMTQLPGVRGIDRYGKNFQGDSKLAVQQIYNNTYQNVTLSEVYLLPKSIDPEKIDPNTGKPEEPIITFDEFIVGGAAKAEEAAEEGAAPGEPAEELEEVEIFEYRLMKKQLEYLSQTYPTNTSFEGLAVPAITGEAVVTCDNSEFTKADLDSGNDLPRMGILYTLPVYNKAGAYNGAVSGIVRVNVLRNLVPAGTHGVINIANKFEGTTNPIKEFTSASEYFQKGLPDPNLIYSTVRKLNVVDTTEWNLWVALPNSEFYSLTSVKQANVIFYSGVVAVLLLVAGMFMAVRTSQSYAASLEAKVTAKTSELSARNAAMKLVFDHSKEGFMTCGLDGMIGSEYSQAVVNWFGHPKAGVPISKFLFPQNESKAAMFQISWDQLVEDFMPFEVTADQMSSYFLHGDRWLTVNLTAIRGEKDKLERIMAVISDVTERVEAEKSARAQKEIMAVFQHLQDDRAGFIEFFADAEHIVRTLTSEVESGLSKDEEFRLMHTLKGNCGQYGLATLADVCHELETALSDGPDKLSPEQIKALNEGWKDATTRLMKLIGEKKNSTIELEESEYLHVLAEIRKGASHKLIADKIEKWKMVPVAKRLERMAEQAKSLAARIGVENLEVSIQTEHQRIHPDQFKNVWSAMIHVVRNAVDHGLKNISGRAPTLTFAATGTENKDLVITVRDNGNGISWNKVREKAKSMGLKAETKKDLEECLFADGLSTSDSVTSVSGRGVGMAAVKEAVLDEGGSIAIKSEDGKGTEFSFTLPLHPAESKHHGHAHHAHTHVSPPDVTASLKNRKILLVDDENAMLDITAEMLKDAGCTVLTANNVHDALNIMYVTSDLDVVITDSRMGHERGLEIVSKALSNPSLCQNLIMCSGYLEYLNFDSRVLPLSKPFTEASLYGAVHKVLNMGKKVAA